MNILNKVLAIGAIVWPVAITSGAVAQDVQDELNRTCASCHTTENRAEILGRMAAKFGTNDLAALAGILDTRISVTDACLQKVREHPSVRNVSHNLSSTLMWDADILPIEMEDWRRLWARTQSRRDWTDLVYSVVLDNGTPCGPDWFDTSDLEDYLRTGQ